MEKERKGWISCLFGYAGGSKGQLIVSVILSAISVVSGLALAAYVVKALFFGLSTGISHLAAYHILEKLRLRVADRFLHAPLGQVTAHSIGEIKNIMVDKIEDIEPPLAHMIPEGSGHIILPVVSFVTQDNFLFRCSLKENICLGNPMASDEEVLRAARAAQCDEFIRKLPKGYDTPAGEAGKRLSGALYYDYAIK